MNICNVHGSTLQKYGLRNYFRDQIFNYIVVFLLIVLLLLLYVATISVFSLCYLCHNTGCLSKNCCYILMQYKLS